MKELYNQKDFIKMKKQMKRRTLFLICLLVVFLLFNIIMIAISSYETYKVLKAITLIIDAIFIIIMLTFYLIYITPLHSIISHYKNVLLDKGNSISGKIIKIGKDDFTVSNHISAKEVYFLTNEKTIILYIENIFENIVLQENENYLLIVSNNFIKGYEGK